MGIFKQRCYSGSRQSIGEKYGEDTRELIRNHLEIIYDSAMNKSGSSRLTLLDSALGYLPFIEKYSPGFAEELVGLSRGAHISMNEAVLLQVRQEAIYSAAFEYKSECTSFAVCGRYTPGGEVYIGQNLDLIGAFEEITSVVVLAPDDAPAVMMVLPAGQISNTGLNELGMGVNCNFLSCRGWKVGYPRYLVSRLLLEQGTCSRARDVMNTITELASSRNILISDIGGKIFDFEMTPYEVGVIEANDMLVHSNHFINSKMKKYECANTPSAALSMADSEWRKARLEELLRSSFGRVDVPALMEFLRDHMTSPQSGSSSICMHASPDTKGYHTAASFISDLNNRVMYACSGNPCTGSYIKYEFPSNMRSW